MNRYDYEVIETIEIVELIEKRYPVECSDGKYRYCINQYMTHVDSKENIKNITLPYVLEEDDIIDGRTIMSVRYLSTGVKVLETYPKREYLNGISEYRIIECYDGIDVVGKFDYDEHTKMKDKKNIVKSIKKNIKSWLIDKITDL